MLKKWKVREKYIASGWTYVKANTKEEAIDKLENGDIDYDGFEEDDWDHLNTDWDTIQEDTEAL